MKNTNDKKLKKERERDRIKRNISETLGLIVLLFFIFIIFAATTDDCKFGKITNLKGCYANKNIKSKGSKQVYSTVGYQDLNDSRIKITEKPEEYNKEIMEGKRKEAIENIENYKDETKIKIESINYYIDMETGSLIIEGLVANYTNNFLVNPKIQASFYNKNNQRMETVIVILEDIDELEPNMIKEFEIKSKSGLTKVDLTEGVSLSVLGDWKKD